MSLKLLQDCCAIILRNVSRDTWIPYIFFAVSKLKFARNSSVKPFCNHLSLPIGPSASKLTTDLTETVPVSNKYHPWICIYCRRFETLKFLLHINTSYLSYSLLNLALIRIFNRHRFQAKYQLNWRKWIIFIHLFFIQSFYKHVYECTYF